MQFEFATATRIIFGEGTVSQVVPAAKQWGSRILLVTGHNPDRAQRLRADLEGGGARCFTFAVKGEPTVDLIGRGLDLAHERQCDVVIAIGGGSVIDAGKAIAGLLTNPGDVMDYLEVVGKGNALQNPAAPFIAVPTTAGTGSEVTRNAVLGVPERQVKVSLRSPHLLPRLAVVDPELTIGLPAAVTASTGLDALTQLIEAYVSIRANPLTDGFCARGIPLAARSLRRAFHHGHESEARHDMLLAALLSGMALANAGLGVVHGFAAPLGGRFTAPHGAICAAILPYGIEINLRALRARDPQSVALRRYQEVGRMLTGWPGATAENAIAWTWEICHELEIPPLKAYGVGEQDIPTLIAEAAKSSSMKGNPLALTAEELSEILTRARD
ncbi:MAG: iron-containing alcohol dehydrogenase [Acidobacteriota bacterium]|nr:iron-containing alcohol dehydrogenase [Acidobacteriota bacterium]